MRIKGVHIILVLAAAALTSCIEEYWPTIEKYENLLVVDGMITNEPGPYTVRLSISSALTNPRYVPVNGATVVIRDQAGNEEILTEKEEGTYQTDPDGIKGIVGGYYQAEIETENGEKYLSPFTMLRDPVEIDTVYAFIEYRSMEDELYDLSGYQFYLDTKTAPADTNYLLWDLWATYKYNSEFKIRYYFDGSLKEFPKPDSLKTCWRTYKVQQIFLSETAGLSSPVIKNFPLHFVATDTKELSIRYSLLVKQWTLGSKDYKFWGQVKKQNEETGGLYSYQPYQIRGNMINPEDPEEPVLGNFTVAGISQQRIYVRRPGVVMTYFQCELTDNDIENFATIYLSPPQSWPVYATTSINGARALPNQECMDCRLSGGTIIKPEFWTDY